MLGKDIIVVFSPMVKLGVVNHILWLVNYFLKQSLMQVGYGANKGIVPIACNEIFDRITKLKSAS